MRVALALLLPQNGGTTQRGKTPAGKIVGIAEGHPSASHCQADEKLGRLAFGPFDIAGKVNNARSIARSRAVFPEKRPEQWDGADGEAHRALRMAAERV